METFVEGDNFPAFFVMAGEPDELAGGFVGFSAAVTEKRLPLEGGFVQALGEFDLGLSMETISDVPELFGLVGRGLDEGGMTMAKNRAAETGEEIEVAFVIGIPDETAFAAGHDHRLPRVVVNKNLIGPLQNFLGLGHHFLFNSAKNMLCGTGETSDG